MINTDIAIIGAGIIGTTSALYLSQQGLQVSLIEQQDIASGASYGNAGALAFSEILPMASPRIMHKAFKWMLDPLGPLSLPPAYLPKISPWLLRFWLASREQNHQKNIQAQQQLMQLAHSETFTFFEQHQLQDQITSDGVLEIYDNAASFNLGQAGAKIRKQYGIETVEISPAVIPDYQPGLADNFKYAMYLPLWHNIKDPNLLTQKIAELAFAQGTKLIRRQAVKLYTESGQAIIQLNDARQVSAKKVIICAGARSHLLSKQTGDRIPLETERGYNTTLGINAFDLKRQITFVDHGFVVSPLSCGIRVGGSVELAGLKRQPNLQRAKSMLQKASRFLPGLDTSNGVEWMGFRPSTPDSLPVIGKSSKYDNFIYAFGHGHLGLTQAAATAKLVSQIATGTKPSINLHPYRPNRFGLII